MMKKKIASSHGGKRLAAILCALALAASAPFSTQGFAEVNGDGTPAVNEAYAGNESLQPLPGGYQVDTLLKWTPESDPDARYARASVPLAKNRTAGPQVNPNATPEAKLMACTLSNANHDNTPVQGSETFDSYAFTYWQYVDTMVYWAGSNEGIFVVPTPDIIDSAHKNGVPVTATLGFPWGPDDTEGKIRLKELDKFVQQNADGSFPVADKMVELAKYYGFDGYFFNQETYGSTAAVASKMRDMMIYVHKKYPDFIFDWYDSVIKDGSVKYGDAVNDDNKMWMEKDASGNYAVDGFFMNYNWGGDNGKKTSEKYPDNTEKVPGTVATMQSIGRSPYDAYAGFEVQQNSIATPIRDHLLVDENGKLKLSIALYCPNSTMGFSKDPVDFHEREKRFWVGSSGNPSYEPLDPRTPDNWEWVGMSRFFTDKTVIRQAPFVTNFNTGHGKQWYVDGKVSRTAEWNNRSAQDILPTWTWLVNSEGYKLNGAYDFDDAYNGGSSIQFTGAINSVNDIMLYSTQVTNAKTAEVTFKVNKAGSKVELGLCYGDSYDATNFQYYPLEQGAAGAWSTARVDLSANSGRKLSAVSLRVDGKLQDYKLNVGRIALLSDTAAAASAPAGVTVDEMLYNTANEAQVRMFWEPSVGASYYEVYRVNAAGGDVLISATPNSAYFIPKLQREKGQQSVTVKVVPVNADGMRGAAAVKSIPWAEDENAYREAAYTASPNVALNAQVTGYSGQGEAEPASKALDGTSLNGSKWCHAGVNEGWMSIKLDAPKTVRRWRVEHAEAGGEGAISNTIDFSLQYKDSTGAWKTAKQITGNTAAITDVVLDQPVTAQEWRLSITKADGGKWVAIRVYEWQMFESSALPPQDAIPARFAKVENAKGAADAFTLTHVPAGVTIRLFSDIDKKQQLATGTPDANGMVSIRNLNLSANGGRVYYTAKSAISNESSVVGVLYEAESAQKTPAAKSVAYAPFQLAGAGTDSRYVNVTVSGLQAGDVVSVYESAQAASYLKKSLPVESSASSVTLRQVKKDAGQSLYFEVKRNGMLVSDRYTAE